MHILINIFILVRTAALRTDMSSLRDARTTPANNNVSTACMTTAGNNFSKNCTTTANNNLSNTCTTTANNNLSNATNVIHQRSHIQLLPAPPLQPRLFDPFNRHNDAWTMQSEANLDNKKHAIHVAAASMRKYLNQSHPGHSSWLIHTIKQICSLKEKELQPTAFRFENNSYAAEWNSKVLKSYNYDYAQAVADQPFSIVTPGSEFRDVAHIKMIWKHRQNWKQLESIITKGVSYPLIDTQSEKIRMSDLRARVERGNHKSALKPENSKALTKAINKEVDVCFLIPIKIKSIFKIKGAGVTPLGVAEQMTISAAGETIKKYRPCHDASFPSESGTSVNLEHDADKLTVCIYGRCLHRIIHSLHRTRLEHPDKVILLFKYDFDAAYRRLHVVPDQAVKTIIVIGLMAYILARLPFGVLSGPSRYSDISEGIFDLANDIIMDPTWDPTTLHSPHYTKLQSPEIIDSTVQFTTAKPLAIKIPYRPMWTDGYIDDAITYAVDYSDNVIRAQNAAPLALHTIFRPAIPSEKDIRNDPISERKLEGDGTPSERKIVLGWLLDTRAFRIYLPSDKAVHWISEINRLIQPEYRIKTKELESTVGRLNHAAHILPHGRYFMNRIRRLLYRCQQFGPQLANTREKQDFRL